jgi:hypothetical protein
MRAFLLKMNNDIEDIENAITSNHVSIDPVSVAMHLKMV